MEITIFSLNFLSTSRNKQLCLTQSLHLTYLLCKAAAGGSKPRLSATWSTGFCDRTK